MRRAWARYADALTFGWRNRRTLAIVAAMLRPGQGHALGWNLRRALTPADARRAAVSLLRGQDALLEIEHDGVRWTVDVGDSIGEQLFSDGSFQRDELRAVLSWIEARPGVVVDLGANIGPTAIACARAGRAVVAVEPVPSTFALLRRNVEQNELDDRVTCVRHAISSASHVEMWTSSASGQNEVRVQDQPPGFLDFGVEAREPVQVDAIGLDDLVTSCGLAPADVALVWSDTQGSEADVIDTGTHLWASAVPLWVEVWPAGLRLHGGSDRFLESVQRHFRAFIPRDDLVTGRRRERPIAGFATWFATVQYETDVLLIP